MTEIPTPPHRARDPGKRLFQYLAEWGGVNWVNCPSCGGPARDTHRRITCIQCGYAFGAKEQRIRKGQLLMLQKGSPACAKCKAPIPGRGRALRPDGDDATPMAQVKCPTCGHRGAYRAYAGRSTLYWSRGLPYRRAPYLRRPIGNYTLWVYNLDHLDALESWLGATLRERPDKRGLTMMARLPRWMKAASARPKVLQALAEMREEAERVGITRD
ncbi:hypothetical protein FPZ54_05980 [Sphingomonas suaedae]|uniref:Uncharacterized protein n=1 Tax=Sphingomonas suaedae TaxID=2599297 RepID=A0A518RDS0_9SPHN|nr:hypothetical protein [Sphingomonas suaedae]QDX25610.1 hypothetical protein FPZ54_05980 [Sphingomonas suaedae]